LLAVGLLASGASSLLELYSKLSWFDELLHMEIPLALTLLLGLYGYGAVLTGAREHGLLLVLTIAGMGLSLAAVWEVWEWIYDQFVRPNAILGKTDTIIDMVMGAVGSLAAAYACLRVLR
jgi:hypothetical protein